MLRLTLSALLLASAALRGQSFLFCRASAGRPGRTSPLLSASSSSSADKVDHLHYAEYPDDDFAHILGINDPKHVPSKLQQISALRLKDVALSKAGIDCQGCGFDPSFFVSAEDLERDIMELDAKLGKPLNLKSRLSHTWPEMAIAAEFKKASPSKGDINLKADAVEQSLLYNRMGAAVISVLTEYAHFKGTLTELKRVRLATQEACLQTAGQPLRPAILRKDFILDRYQILEARAHGADTVLLIVAVLGVRQLQDLIAFSREWGMEPLVEVHTQREMEIALDCGAQVIGVNNRNLHTFQLDLDTTARAISIAEARGLRWRPTDPALGAAAAPDVTVAALSGITTADDVAGFRDVGVGCCLIGETLMKSADPSATIAALLRGGRLDQRSAAATSASAGTGAVSGSRSLVKVCGLTRVQDASAALEAGASLLGVIFAPSPRTATPEQARDIVQAARKYGERSAPVSFSPDLFPASGASSSASASEWFSRCAAALRKTTVRQPLVVGVFQDQTAEEINAAVAAAGLDLVQLHGDESPELAARITVPVIKVLHVPPVSGSGSGSGSGSESQAHAQALSQQAQAWSGKAVALLLDSRLPGARGGGTGAVFDWGLASSVGAPVLLAGGLTPANAAQAASTEGVLGVDVSSGVEVSPGVKDAALVLAFASGVKGR